MDGQFISKSKIIEKYTQDLKKNKLLEYFKKIEIKNERKKNQLELIRFIIYFLYDCEIPSCGYQIQETKTNFHVFHNISNFQLFLKKIDFFLISIDKKEDDDLNLKKLKQNIEELISLSKNQNYTTQLIKNVIKWYVNISGFLFFFSKLESEKNLKIVEQSYCDGYYFVNQIKYHSTKIKQQKLIPFFFTMLYPFLSLLFHSNDKYFETQLNMFFHYSDSFLNGIDFFDFSSKIFFSLDETLFYPFFNILKFLYYKLDYLQNQKIKYETVQLLKQKIIKIFQLLANLDIYNHGFIRQEILPFLT